MLSGMERHTKMEKAGTRLKVLAHKLKMSDTQLAMVLIYIISHDKVFAWTETMGKKSASKNKAQGANVAFNVTCVKAFLEQIGGIIAWKAEDHLTYRGNNKPATKVMTEQINKQIYNEKTNRPDLAYFDKFKIEVTEEGKEMEEEATDIMAGDTDILTDKIKESNNFNPDESGIIMHAGMSRSEFLDYLIQEQRKSKNQKDKNLFTLKIHDFMAFKEDRSNELRPVLYLPFRFEDIGLCIRCSTLMRTFTK